MHLPTEVLTPKAPILLHGGDYNPEQWLDRPDILAADIELMKKAHINCVSLGIFSWAKLEPEKDEFHLEWMEQIIDRLHVAGIYVNLATPSGARPRWLAKEYEEVLRVDERGKRAGFGGRHNHCMTSPVYRERVSIIDAKLAERFGKHPAVILWHVSNEYEGECFCPLCQQAFRSFLKNKYRSIDVLNKAWWTTFWSHEYRDFEEIEAPGSMGEHSINGLTLDWKRFVTSQTTDFMIGEIRTLKRYAPDLPVTTNMMGLTDVLCYPRMAQELDLVSWDSYPSWHEPGNNVYQGMLDSFTHDYMRCLKKRPFILMESTPSTVNWRPVCKLKKPGMHRLSMLNAIGHGSQSAMYFQIRQSAGGPEKFHSAVISHVGTEETRVFREVAALGEELASISDLVYSTVSRSEVAILYDKENKWALDNSCGPRNAGLDYDKICVSFYGYFWKRGINVDVLDSSASLEGYKLVVAPMLYMLHNGIQEKLRTYVKEGGTLLTTAFSCMVNESDLCFLGQASEEKLSDVLGYYVEETDALYDGEWNHTLFHGKTYRLDTLCEVIRCTTARVLSVYGEDFYKGQSVITVNPFGCGKAYHLAAYGEESLYEELLDDITGECAVHGVLGNAPLPDGVGAVSRRDSEKTIVFIGNFADEKREIQMEPGLVPFRYLSGDTIGETISLEPFEMKMLIRNS